MLNNRVNIKAEKTIANLNPVLFPNIEINEKKKKKLNSWGLMCWQMEGKRRKRNAEASYLVHFH